MSDRRLVATGTGLVLAGVLLLAGSALATGNPNGPGAASWGGGGMMRGATGAWRAPAIAPGPGGPGFVAGTAAAPRVVRILATPQLRFLPATVTVQAGETITFQVTTMGPVVHEFMVGPAAAVEADQEGTAEIADIGMMQAKSLTYTFAGSGPFAFACHAPGHYEAGMRASIVIVP